MRGVFHSEFMGSKMDGDKTSVTVLGCPLDTTSSFRSGSKFAPESIRKASWTLETYSPYLKMDLIDMEFTDAGDLELPTGYLLDSLELIGSAVADLTWNSEKLLVLGGEHLVTYPVMKVVQEHFRDIQIVHFDAHCDLRDEYEGQKFSHATVMNLVRELGITDIFQVGIRSGTKREFDELRLVDSPVLLASSLDRQRPVYITFDMDVFDPSLVPGVATPEPGGLMFKEIMEYFHVFQGMRIVAADIVELSPDYDSTFVSSVTAAKVAREMLLLLNSRIE